ncbi:MAG: hypothetical protein LUD55_05435 [Oscillospiraceae bacterium]|nr:hypothetical protein [Oscillospiraceae bacterium]
MSRTSKILVALALALLLTGCSSAAAEVSYAPPESERLTVYTSHKEEVYSPIIREFEERTGIWVEVVTGGTNELLDRLEREADSPAADVMFGGGVESLEHYGELFTPLSQLGGGEYRPAVFARRLPVDAVFRAAYCLNIQH